MSSTSTTRIPTEPNLFVAYMRATDDYQLSDDPDNPGNPLFEKWQWTALESTQWTGFRNQADTLFTTYNDANFVTSTIRRQMMLLIEEVNEFDHDKDTGHKLLDKVAMFGNVPDCTKFHVVRGTVLADENPTESPDLGTKTPAVSVRGIRMGEHELTVINPETPESKGLPEGVKFANVYRFIGSAAPASIKDYEFVGVAKRGLFLSDLTDFVPNPTQKSFAYYVTRYQGNDGALGNPSAAVKAMILEE